MSFFDDTDPFEDIVNQFFGNRRRISRGYKTQEENEENTYTIEEKDYIYIIIEVPGYQKEDIKVDANERVLRIKVNKKKSQEEIQKEIPQRASPKKFSYTYTNGILEVKFARK